MLKIAKMFPLLFPFYFAVMYYGLSFLDVFHRVFRSALNGRPAAGVAISFVFGLSATLLFLAFYYVIKKKLVFLGVSLAYAGTCICCWLGHFGVPPLWGMFPKVVHLYSDYVVMLMVALAMFGCHFVVESVKRKKYNFNS